MPRKQPGPPCQICGKPSIAKKLCEMHYRRLKRHGHFENTRPDDWGQRSKHPLWQTWKHMRRAYAVRGWDDFWDFVKEVGERPGIRFMLARHHETKPFGPANWYWREPILGAPDISTRERKNTYMREWMRKNPIRKKQYDLKKLYGITLVEYEALLVEQDGKCAICGQKDEHFNLAVDHCHGTNTVRGLLCSLCNRGIGMFRHSPDLLMRAVEYLKNPKRLI